MKSNKTRKTVTIASTLLLGIVLLGCSGLDVVARYAPDSLRTIETQYPEVFVQSEQDVYRLSVDGDTQLVVSADFSKTTGNDVVLETPLSPFLDAGLDVSQLPDGLVATEDKLMMNTEFSNVSRPKNQFTDALIQTVQVDRKVLSYHTELDHYGIELSYGKFEWAKDHLVNDKDVVFILKAEPLKQAGLDAQNVEGWVFAVMKEDSGKEVELLLKPYNLNDQ